MCRDYLRRHQFIGANEVDVRHSLLVSHQLLKWLGWIAQVNVVDSVVCRAVSQQVAGVRVELHRAYVGLCREGEERVRLPHAPQFDSAVVTARGK